MWMFKHMQCPSFDKTCSNEPMDGLRPFLVTVDVSPCVSTPLSRPKPPRYACPVAWAWREKPVRVWGEGRGNPSAVGLTGLAATWSYIYRVYEGLFCPFYLLPPTSSSFNLCALTNPALLATGRGCVAMWQGDRVCFSASSAAFRVNTCFRVNTQSESPKILAAAEQKANSVCMEGLWQGRSVWAVWLFIITMEEILLCGWVMQWVMKAKHVFFLTLAVFPHPTLKHWFWMSSLHSLG